MKRAAISSAGLVIVVFAIALVGRLDTVAGQQAADQTQAEINRLNLQYVRQITEKIQGRTGEPAEQVFANVQNLKGIPASQLLVIMNRGYSQALGVACTHCHDPENFAGDDKRPKRAAREMSVMHRMINDQLAAMDNLATPKTANRAIACSTCHRGTVNAR